MTSTSDTRSEITIHKCDRNCDWECESAASVGDIERLKRAHKNGCKWNEMTTLGAARSGHLECLMYAHKNGCKLNIFTTNQAAERGHIECLKYVYENGVKLHPDTCKSAARNGHVNCLKYAHKNGCALTTNIYNTIAYSTCKSIECFKYLHENNCLWNEHICRDIVLRGNIELLKYAHENGFEWGEDTCIHLFEEANIECIKYAYDHGCTWYEDYKIYKNPTDDSNIGKNDNKLLDCWNKKSIEKELHYNDYYYTPTLHPSYHCINDKYYDKFIIDYIKDIGDYIYLAHRCWCCDGDLDEEYISLSEKEKRKETLEITLNIIRNKET